MNEMIKRYLDQFQAGLQGVPSGERAELVREIENHIAEAMAAGQPLADVLAKLGPADRLAKAYSAELLIAAPGQSGNVTRAKNWFAILGVLAASSIPSLVIIPLLGGLSIGFTVGGAGAAIAGVLALIFPGLVTPDFLPYGVAQMAAIIVGVVLFALGVVSFYGLKLYIKVIIKTIKKVSE